jgi:hypothetical protein
MADAGETVTMSWWGLSLLLFVAIKLAGHVLAAWSWLWVIVPIVPLLGLLVERVGL